MARRRDDDYEEDDYDDRRRNRRRDDDEDDDYDDRPRGTPPPNYLVHAILATLCCCLPTGIAAIVFAAQVNSKWEEGDYEGARRSSEKAKLWAMISIPAGLVVGVLNGILQFAVMQQQGR